MPVVHKSAIKRARQAEARNRRNRAVLSTVRSAVRKVVTALEGKKVEEARACLREATAILHRAATKGVLKRNTASRKVSRLAAKVNSLAASGT
ncbi:MAG: 30S ribosomal protein S20 [Nitrospiraceae bacterium]